MTSAIGGFSFLNQYQPAGSTRSKSSTSDDVWTAVAAPFAKMTPNLALPGTLLSATPMDPSTVLQGVSSGTAPASSTVGGTINVTA